LRSFGDVEGEVLMLSAFDVKTCRGCKVCLDRGEELCPLHDDRDALIEKMTAADGVVIASPNYSFQVSAITKIFLDRIGFAFHRPRFFGKAFTSIVAQGIYGGPKIVKYLDFVGDGLGFNVVKGSCITTVEPMTEDRRRRIDGLLVAHARRFHDRLLQPAYPAPTFLELMLFRMARTSIPLMIDEAFRDVQYYREKGWFESDYFYPVRLNPLKRAAGKMFDYAAARSARKQAAAGKARLH
jgi:NAD(P)H-dependent FMN reductase